jgi:hypothetical protein
MPNTSHGVRKGKKQDHDWNELKIGENTYTIEYPVIKQLGKANPEDIQFSYAL